MTGRGPVKRRRFAYAVVLGLALWVLWLQRGEPGAEAPPSVDAAVSAPPHRGKAPFAEAAPLARKADAPGDERLGFGGAAEEPSPPSLLEQLGAVHGMVSQAQVSAYLEKNAELAARHVERFCEEAGKLEDVGLSESRRHGDASGYLVGRVGWELESGPSPGSLQLPQALADKLSQAGTGWPEAFAEADLAGLDFSWLSELQGYDTWDVAAAGPLEDYQGTRLYDAPAPSYATFTRWLKLRFAKALRDGDLPQAVAQARHVAALLHSQGMLIGDMVALHALRLEREAYDVAVRQGRSVAGWTPPDREDLDAWRRLSRSAPNFLFPGVDPKVMRRALECAPTPCSAVTEAAFAQVALGDFASTSNAEAFWALAKEQPCERGVREKICSGRPLSPTDGNATFGGDSQVLEKYFGSAK